MVFMLCRNRVADFDSWKQVFDAHAAAHREAGLKLVQLGRGVDRPDDVFFIFQVGDLGKARAFIDNPAAAEAGEASGVVDGEYHFVETG